jgi:hypothetical protein
MTILTANGFPLPTVPLAPVLVGGVAYSLSAANSITIPVENVVGQPERYRKIEIAIDGVGGFNGANFASCLKLNLNGDVTALHYNHAGEYNFNSGAIVGGMAPSVDSLTTAMMLGVTGSNPSVSMSAIIDLFPLTGKSRKIMSRYSLEGSTTANNTSGFFGGYWTNTIDPITTILITFGQAFTGTVWPLGWLNAAAVA